MIVKLSVSTVATFAGEGGLSVGNILGSNIANLTIIIGVTVFLNKTEVSVKGQSQK